MRNRKFVLHQVGLAAAVLGWLLASGSAQDMQTLRSLPLPEARFSGPADLAEGNLWMGWSPDHRLGYVQGLMEGAFWAYLKACGKAQIAATSVPGLRDKCMADIPAARLQPKEYVELMTQFYSKYPQDRALPIHRLLLKLLEPGMTVDGVHKWLDEIIEQAEHSRGK